MIAVPVPLGIQAGQEQVLLLELIQAGLGMADAGQGVAGGGIHLDQDGGVGQEGLPFPALAAEDLFRQVLENIAVRTAQAGNEAVGAVGILALKEERTICRAAAQPSVFSLQQGQALLGETGDGQAHQGSDLVLAETQVRGRAVPPAGRAPADAPGPGAGLPGLR